MRCLCSPSLKSPILRPFRSHSPRIAATLVGGGGPAGEAPPDELPPPHPVLPTPTASSASQASVTFTFSQPTGAGSDRVQNVETFGYEVYYRFSAVGESTERNLQDRAQLDASGFVSLRQADDRHPIGVTERPLIVVAVAARRITASP